MGMFKTGGGGFLNGVDGVIAGYQFTTTEFVSKKTKEPYTKLSVEFSILQDGADEPVKQFADAGFFYPENQSISADGLTLESDDEGAIIRADTYFARFIGSLVAKGFPEDRFNPDGRNFEPMVGTRVTFIKVVDEEATKDRGRRKDKKDPKKSYPIDYLAVGAVLALPEATKTTPKGSTKKTAAKTATKPTTKATKTPAPPAEAPDTTQADEAIVQIVADYGKEGSILRSAVSGAVVRYGLKNKLAKDVWEGLRKQLYSEEYLVDATARGVVAYDGKDVVFATA